jgi:hypothetical protein
MGWDGDAGAPGVEKFSGSETELGTDWAVIDPKPLACLT